MSDWYFDNDTSADGLKGHSGDMTYSGPLSFLRRKFSRNIDNADVVVSGVPFDCSTSYRPGCRLGPRAIRAASVQLADLPTFPFGFDLFEHLAIIDYGDVHCEYGYHEAIKEVITDHAQTILATNAKMLTFGGDHFVTYPLICAHAKKYAPLSMIQFDAHLDTWFDDGKSNDHGAFIARLSNEEVIDTSRSVQVGIRTFNENLYGLNVLDAPFVHEEGVKQTIKEIKRIVADNNVYITFDIDCLDPSVAPGTGTPISGGLSMAQALSIMRSLGDLNIVGMDVVEVSPSYDVSEITAIAAATLGHTFLCLEAMRKGASPIKAKP